MEQSNFLSVPQKRTEVPDPNSTGGAKKRSRPNQVLQPLSVSPGHAVFRMLCLVSQVGSVIGKSGSIIKELQQTTGAKVRVEEAPSHSLERVITVIAQAAPSSKVKLGIKNPSGEEEEEIEVSKAQEALLRVFELVIGADVVSGLASCKLLAGASQAGAVIGKGGKVVEKMRKETGCRISVVTENLPLCAESDEEMVQIEGEVLNVKKALLLVSSSLQDAQAINTTRVVGNRNLNSVSRDPLYRHVDTVVLETSRRPVEVLTREPYLRSIDMFPQDSFSRPIQYASEDALRRHTQLASVDALHRRFETAPRDILRRPGDSFLQDPLRRRIETIPRETFPEMRSDLFSLRNSAVSAPSRGALTSAAGLYSLSKDPFTPESAAGNQKVVFKILCSTDTAGGVIGRGGSIIKSFQSETGANIGFGNTLPDCDERLITITASENLELRISPAQMAVILIFSRALEVATEKGLNTGSDKGSSVTARLVVPTNQVGCLLGKGGAVISEMRIATGTGIQVLKVEQSPKCISENEQVVQITGEPQNVREAICHITNILRESLFPDSVKSTGDKSSSSQMIEKSPQVQMEDSVLTRFQPSYNHSQSLSITSHVRSEDFLPSGFPTSASYHDTLATNLHERSEPALPYGFQSSVNYSETLDRPSLADHNGLSSSLDHFPSQSSAPQTLAPEIPRGNPDISGGLASARAGLMLGSASKSAIVTNTTMDISVPESAMVFIYGEDGRNLEHLRKSSGARVIVHEPQLGTSDRTIVISGTPEQTQAAQNLLHTFILHGETSRLNSA